MWTPAEARHWAASNGFRSSKAREDGPTIHIEQHDASKFRRTTFRTVQLDDGVQAVIAVPVEPLPAERQQTFGEALSQLRQEIAANKQAAASEWQRQKRNVADKVQAVRRARQHGPDPVGDFFTWVKKRMR